MLRNTGNSERKQRGQFDVCFIQQLTTEPITDSQDPDTTKYNTDLRRMYYISSNKSP